MRIRDKHFLFAELVMTCSCLCVCAFAIYVSNCVLRRVSSRLSEFETRLASAERTTADACAVAVALSEARPTVSDSVEENDSVPVKVLGYGQSKTARRRFVYRDLLLSDGTTQREIVQWLPL